MKRRSYKVALGGIVSAMSLLVMLMGSVFPGLEYATPAFAGMLFVMIVIEIGVSWAWVTYACVALLVFFVVPNKESALLFIAFLGYYPILKSVFETKLKGGALQWFSKLAVFNAAVLAYYKLVMLLVASPELGKTAEELGKYALYILLALANGVFVIYDVALTKVISLYEKQFRKKILSRFLK